MLCVTSRLLWNDVPIKRDAGTWGWGERGGRQRWEGGGREEGTGGELLSLRLSLSPAGSSWRILAEGEGTTWQRPLWHTDGNFYNCCRAHLYVLLSSYRRRAVSPLNIQFSWEALLPQCVKVRLSVKSRDGWDGMNSGFNDGIGLCWQEQKTELRTALFMLRGCLCVTFGTAGLFSLSSDTVPSTAQTSQMKHCDADEATSGKRTHLNMPQQLLTHIF